MRLPLPENQSNEGIHAQYCTLRNRRTALVITALFVVEVYVSWRGLGRPSLKNSLIELPFYIAVFVISAKLFVIFRCFRERLVMGLATVAFVMGVASGYFPTDVSRFAPLASYGRLALWSLALLISLSMLVESARNPYVEIEGGNKMTVKRALLILCTAILTMLLIGALMYLVPLR